MNSYTVAVGHNQKSVSAPSPEKALHSVYPKHLWTFKARHHDEGGPTFEYITTVKRFQVSAYIWDTPT